MTSPNQKTSMSPEERWPCWRSRWITREHMNYKRRNDRGEIDGTCNHKFAHINKTTWHNDDKYIKALSHLDTSTMTPPLWLSHELIMGYGSSRNLWWEVEVDKALSAYKMQAVIERPASLPLFPPHTPSHSFVFNVRGEEERRRTRTFLHNTHEENCYCKLFQ